MVRFGAVVVITTNSPVVNARPFGPPVEKNPPVNNVAVDHDPSSLPDVEVPS